MQIYKKISYNYIFFVNKKFFSLLYPHKGSNNPVSLVFRHNVEHLVPFFSTSARFLFRMASCPKRILKIAEKMLHLQKCRNGIVVA